MKNCHIWSFHLGKSKTSQSIKAIKVNIHNRNKITSNSKDLIIFIIYYYDSVNF